MHLRICTTLLLISGVGVACSTDSDSANPFGANAPTTNYAGTTNSGTTNSGTTNCPPCTDVLPEQGNTCEDWLAWGECDAAWMQGYCDATCGRCDATCSGSSGGTGGSGSTGGGTANVDPLPSGAQNGWASRYWDCCKPHCAWSANAPGGALKMCNVQNQPLSDPDAPSSCDGGPAYTCWNMAPWAVADNLAYGFAATPSGGNDCGKCYQLEFTGSGQHNANDPGSKSLAGKTMIVQATNVGGDVGGGQFDLLIPGGGVGAFNGCSQQWGVSDLGAQYGGFLTSCNGDVSCLRQKCQEVFSGKPDLLDGCLFHVEWMQGADNPQLRYAQVPCPSELTQISGMR